MKEPSCSGTAWEIRSNCLKAQRFMRLIGATARSYRASVECICCSGLWACTVALHSGHVAREDC